MTLALYIHWPFCLSKCPYCDFNSHVRDGIDVAAWENALLADLRHEASLTSGRTLGSIFFGGGTPSLMPPSLVARLIEEAARLWPFAPDIEITLEANPTSVEAASFADLAQAGVNRVSLGLQSLDDTALRFLGRHHSAQEGRAALATAQRHFARVSFDLIYARPGLSLPAWERELAEALSFGTGHLSLYQLTVEPGTRFATDLREKRLAELDEDSAADMFAATRELTAAAGLPAYETSNHARLGEESRHNLTYWRYGDYIGVGPGAHGRRLASATERVRKPENYLAAVAEQGNGIGLERKLDQGTQVVEALLMGLRLREGVDLSALATRFAIPGDLLIDPAKVALYTGLGFLIAKGNRLTVTDTGAPLLDGLLGELVQAQAVAA